MKRITIVGMYAALLAGSISVANAEIKVGVVSLQRLYSESVQAKEAGDVLSREFDARYADLQKQEKTLQDKQDKLTKDAATMTEMQKSAADRELNNGIRDLQAQRSRFEDDLEARKQDENVRLGRILQDHISAFAKQQKFDLILADGVLYADGALDVTNAILQSLETRKSGAPAGAAAPASKPAAQPGSTAKP